MRIVLASGSPRRRELLTWAGFEPVVRPTGVPEVRAHDEAPIAYARRLAQCKAEAADAAADEVVLAADTVVHRNGLTYDKPVDRAEAVQHLHALQGQAHVVTTAVAIRRGSVIEVFSVDTEVSLRALSAAEIAAYVATGEADDKAGAYAIQGRGGVFVGRVVGSWTNVMGLPIDEVVASLRGPA